MIYIKDYGSLNKLVSGSRPCPAAGIPECLLGKSVIVFTQSGGCSGCGFTGILVEICEGIIKLVRPSCAITCTRGCRQSCRAPNEAIVIAREHITAIIFNGV